MTLRKEIASLCKGMLKTKQYNPDSRHRSFAVWYGNSMICDHGWVIGDKDGEQAALKKVLGKVEIALHKLQVAHAVANCVTMSAEAHPSVDTIMDIFRVIAKGADAQDVIGFCDALSAEFDKAGKDARLLQESASW